MKNEKERERIENDMDDSLFDFMMWTMGYDSKTVPRFGSAAEFELWELINDDPELAKTVYHISDECQNDYIEEGGYISWW